jgi:DNA polymerase-1
VKAGKYAKAFIPRNSDYILLSCDYSQIELRLIAELSKDANMVDAFQKGLDIHTATAAKVYNVPIDEVTPDQRRNAKTVNFVLSMVQVLSTSSSIGYKKSGSQKRLSTNISCNLAD